MRIAFHCNLMGWPKASSGGVRQWVLALANGLVERGHDVDVLCEAPTDRFKDEPRLDARVGRVVLGARGSRATRALHDYVRARPGVRIVAALNHFNVGAVRLKAPFGDRVHVMLTQHEHLSGDRVWRVPIKYWLMSRAVRRDFNRADVVVGVSTAVTHDIEQRLGPNHTDLRTIFNPAFSESFLELAREPVAHPWFDDKTIPVIVAAGRLHPVKGFDLAIEAFAQVVRQRPARLLILGEGRVRRRLEAQVRALGLGDLVALPGRVETVLPWLARSDLFVLPSRSEAFGNALIEALAVGLKIVAADCPGGPAEILENGRWGMLVPVADVDALARGMIAALDAGPADASGMLGRARAFSVDAAIDRYLEAWNRTPKP